jgi:hypothetical protein
MSLGEGIICWALTFTVIILVFLYFKIGYEKEVFEKLYNKTLSNSTNFTLSG